jgi:hypothetical protein
VELFGCFLENNRRNPVPTRKKTDPHGERERRRRRQWQGAAAMAELQCKASRLQGSLASRLKQKAADAHKRL